MTSSKSMKELRRRYRALLSARNYFRDRGEEYTGSKLALHAHKCLGLRPEALRLFIVRMKPKQKNRLGVQNRRRASSTDVEDPAKEPTVAAEQTARKNIVAEPNRNRDSIRRNYIAGLYRLREIKKELRTIRTLSGIMGVKAREVESWVEEDTELKSLFEAARAID